MPAAIRRMTKIGAELEEDDGIARFNWLYLQVTTEVQRRLDEQTYFRDNRFLATLDVAFANRYLDALRTWTRKRKAGEPDTTPAPWRVLFERRDRPGIAGIQFAAAGVNAHINFDLPLALVATWDDPGVGRPKEDSIQRYDYDKVTDIFGELYDDFRRQLLPPMLDRFDDGAVEAALNRASHVAVDKARDLAWRNGRGIDGVRRRPSWIRGTLVDTLESLTSQAGHLLLEPVA